jgi:hypothetical protein
VRICLDAHIRTIVVLTGGKLTGFSLQHFLYAIYYSITTHLQQGKKVSFLPLGNVNPRPVPSRRGLFEDSPYHAVGAVIVGWVLIFWEVWGKSIGGDLDVHDEGSEQHRFEPVQSLHHGSVGYQPMRTFYVPASESRTQARTGKNNLELQMND